MPPVFGSPATSAPSLSPRVGNGDPGLGECLPEVARRDKRCAVRGAGRSLKRLVRDQPYVDEEKAGITTDRVTVSCTVAGIGVAGAGTPQAVTRDVELVRAR